MRCIVIILLLLLYAVRGMAQSQLALDFKPVAGGRPLALEQRFALGGDSLSIATFRFYIGQVCLMKNGQVVATVADGYHLADASLPESLRLNTMVPAGISYDAIRFGLGVDSAVNAAGAQGGDLDATRGMYWAWQSGYINLKLEGTSPRCRTRKHEFQYHLGGFRGKDYCLQVITLPVAHPLKEAHIAILLDRFLNAVDLERDAQEMSPGPTAVSLSALAATMFQLMDDRQ